MAEPSRTRLGEQDRTAGDSSREAQSRDIHHWAGDGNSESGVYGRPMIHVRAAPYGRAFPAPPLRASSHGGSWKALPHGFAGLHTFPFGDLGHFGVV